MGPFIATNYLVKGRLYTAVFHRSGTLVAKLGPWDGVRTHVASDGWVFDAGGDAAHGDWRLPVEELTLRLTTSGPERLIEHFLEFVLPRPGDEEIAWRECAGDNRLTRLHLGKRFDTEVDEMARTTHDGLGVEWAMKMLQDDAVRRVAQRRDQPFDQWRNTVRAALLDAGADVDCVRYAREHGLLKGESQ